MLRVPGIGRPLLAWKYLLLSSALLYVSYCFIFDVPLAASSLPPYTGPYDVGTIDVELPCTRRKISDATFKATGLPAFQLETVLFSIFYPADEETTSRHPPHTWISKPLSLTAEGYARFARINNYVVNTIFTFVVWALGGSLPIPAKVDVPLLIPTGTIQDNGMAASESSRPFPVVVFSPGYATSRTDYTQYCAELASRGYVVAAVEHRDGSSPASVVMREDGSFRVVYPITTSQLQSDRDIGKADLKRIQLAFRQAEVGEIIRVLQSINEGQGSTVFKTNFRREGHVLSGWRGRLAMNQLTIAGHSYGATLALQILKGAPSKSFPVRGAIILDPGKHSGQLNSDIDVPTLVVHSNSWSKQLSIFFGRPHFEVVKELVEGVIRRGKAAWFITSVGTSHMSVADAPLIQPLLLSWASSSTIDAHEGVNQYVKVSVDFLEYLQSRNKGGILAEAITHPGYDQDIRDDKRKETMAKEIGKYWQIHVTPTAT